MDFNLSQLITLVPVSLAVVALVQLVYLLALNTFGSRQRTARRPSAPLMPTQPQGGLYPKTGTAKPSPVVNGKITILSGLASTGDIALPGSTFVIGRFYHPENNILIALDDKSISRRHAQFTGDDVFKTYTLTDLNSTYGTAQRRDGKFEIVPPGQPVRLYNQDVVQFGGNVTIRFTLPGDTRADATQL